MRTRGSMIADIDGRKLLNTVLGMFYPDDIYPSCLTCRKFDISSETCKLNGLHPPIIIIIRGCEKYDDAHNIPF